ncbi:MAG: NAD(P)H-binding protein [Pseudomonadota bacterium]|nr:NAD(P)H-binding protein [Pseudomonadota bacterium]
MTNQHSSQAMTLVLGGTGKTGRRVAERLAEAGYRTRVGSRSAQPAFDWEDQASWAPALEGCSSAYIAFQPDLAVPGALATVQAFFKVAVDAGVHKLVLLSGRGEVEAAAAEEALQKTGADWTILRSSWFCQNFSESYFHGQILAGEVAVPLGLAAEPFVDVDDIAEIAFEALTGSRHTRQLYDITGPRAVGFAEAIGSIASAAGRPVAFIEVSAADYRAALVQQQVPPEYIDLIMYLFATVLDGRNTPLGDGVQRALGRPPRSFEDYVRRTAASGVWGGDHA